MQEQPEGPVSLECETIRQVNFACTQNDVAVVRRLSVRNHTDVPLDRVRVTMRATPPAIRERSWLVDSIAPGDEHAVSDTSVALDIERLAGLGEAEVGELEFRVDVDGIEPLIERCQIALLARDQWGGLSDMAQLLAAFVCPNEPAVAKLLKDASRLLRANGHDGSLDGYQSGDPGRAYLLAAAIWSASTALGLSYAEPPASFEAKGQKVRGPARIVDEGLATCLDTTLLMAAAFEACGLNPVVLFSAGHAWVGVWIHKSDFGHVTESDVVAVRKAVQAHELVPVETTLLTRRPAVGFEEAEDEGRRRLAEHREAEFLMAVDIARSRAAQILPQAGHRPERPGEGTPTDEVVAAPLPERPDFGRLPGEDVDENPQTPQGRIDRWQRKLLDLSLRNRLLNFLSSKQTVPFRCPDAAALEDALAGGTKFRAVSLSDENPIGDRTLSPEDAHRVEEQVALDAFDKKQIAVPLAGPEMNQRLLTLFRRANSDMQEGGTNTLFLAVGFLRWRKTAGDKRDYRAPLLLIPVKLERRSAQSAFRIAHHEDDVRINSTLLEFLKRDFHIQVPELEADLPSDESGTDVAWILDAVRRRIKDVAHFEVVEDVALSTFSFAKYLMWKDLVDRADRLRENRLVRHLIDGPADGLADQSFSKSVQPVDMDRRHSSSSLFTPLPADSSQLAAVVAAAKGADFFLVGPPGTGKSQTIANMIAQCLAEGKTVLFVAEKAAALDVVHRRLVASGLGDGVLELHSNKTDRKSVLAQLGRGWDRSDEGDDAEWKRVTDELTVSRDRLNGYVRALHTKGSQGFSIFTAISRVAQADGARFDVSFATKDAHDEESYRRLVALAGDTARVHRIVGDGPALSLVEREKWSLQWESAFVEGAERFRAALAKLRDAGGTLAEELGLRGDRALGVERRWMLAGLAPRAGDRLLDIAAVPNLPPLHLKDSIDLLAADVDALFSWRSKAAASYPLETIRRLPAERLDADWREAQAKLWPASYFARRRVRRLLQSYAADGEANPAVDLEALIRARERDAAIQDNPLVGIAGGDGAWEVEEAAETTRQAIEFREAVGALHADVEDPAKHEAAIIELSTCEQGPVRDALTRYVAAEGAALESAAAFVDHGGGLPPEASTADVEDGLATVVAERARLADWTAWTETRNRAVQNGLGSLVEALDDGEFDGSAEEAFEQAYASWWLPLAMDAKVELREFRHWDHEDVIETFRQLDERVATLTPREVMRRIAHGLPARDGVPKKSELGVLRHQLGLKRPSMPIRRLLESLPETFGKLAPCVLMSPLSVAQYLPAGRAAFDMVIFDEASQITTWDAIGAIARGRQTIVVGDPKQLPPTNFFGRADDEDEDLPEIERDMPSILDEVAAAGVPERRLDWHYRSRDEALIAFSNRRYYDGRLVTFPAPVTGSGALRFHKVEGIYVRGHNGRVNHGEAEAVAGMVRERLTRWLRVPEGDRYTLGVITFNSEQQSLILDLLDSMRRANADLEWFFSEDREEPVIVKNLENIQGDERDVMLFSVTFGPDVEGKLTMNFGPLNNAGGERRLNVAVTRARRELHVYSSILADQIDLGKTQAKGVADLKAFLNYADRGLVALSAYDEGSLGPAESAFEDAVAEAFRRRGWEVRTQVGVSGFRIDLAVVHPDRAGAYLCGIECDGARYHSSATARDRDKVRQAVLEGLGWSIIRIWSTDWFRDPGGVSQRVHQALEQLLAADRERRADEVPEALLPVDASTAESEPAFSGGDVLQGSKAEQLSPPGGSVGDQEPGRLLPRVAGRFADVASSLEESGRSQTGALAPLVLDAGRFFDPAYSAVVQRLVLKIVEAEGPLPFRVLARRVAEEHGWQRTGKRILRRVEESLGSVEGHAEFGRTFLWVPDQHARRTRFRGLKGRSIQDVSRTEIASVIDDLASEISRADDPMLVLARRLGIARLSAGTRAYLGQCADWHEEKEATRRTP